MEAFESPRRTQPIGKIRRLVLAVLAVGMSVGALSVVTVTHAGAGAVHPHSSHRLAGMRFGPSSVRLT